MFWGATNKANLTDRADSDKLSVPDQTRASGLIAAWVKTLPHGGIRKSCGPR